jgi:tetratricopeptide (TPR) repeat protein
VRIPAPTLRVLWIALLAWAVGVVALGCATVRAPEQLPDFDALWNYQDPAETELAFRKLLPQARASGDRDYLAQLLTQIARALSLQRRFEDAHTTLDEVKPLLPEGACVARARYLLERARTFNSSGSSERARPLFLEAFEVARSVADDYYAVDAAHMLGIIEAPEVAREWNQRALTLAEGSHDPRARPGGATPLCRGLPAPLPGCLVRGDRARAS